MASQVEENTSASGDVICELTTKEGWGCGGRTPGRDEGCMAILEEEGEESVGLSIRARDSSG